MFGFLRGSVNFVIHTGGRQQWPTSKKHFSRIWCILMSEQIIAQSAVAFYASADYTGVSDMKTL